MCFFYKISLITVGDAFNKKRYTHCIVNKNRSLTGCHLLMYRFHMFDSISSSPGWTTSTDETGKDGPGLLPGLVKSHQRRLKQRPG